MNCKKDTLSHKTAHDRSISCPFATTSAQVCTSAPAICGYYCDGADALLLACSKQPQRSARSMTASTSSLTMRASMRAFIQFRSCELPHSLLCSRFSMHCGILPSGIQSSPPQWTGLEATGQHRLSVASWLMRTIKLSIKSPLLTSGQACGIFSCKWRILGHKHRLSEKWSSCCLFKNLT